MSNRPGYYGHGVLMVVQPAVENVKDQANISQICVLPVKDVDMLIELVD